MTDKIDFEAISRLTLLTYAQLERDMLKEELIHPPVFYRMYSDLWPARARQIMIRLELVESTIEELK